MLFLISYMILIKRIPLQLSYKQPLRVGLLPSILIKKRRHLNSVIFAKFFRKSVFTERLKIFTVITVDYIQKFSQPSK